MVGTRSNGCIGRRTMTTERILFRLLHMTCCCSTLLCWVNPRLPNYCPECGVRCYPAVKSCVTDTDENATLRLHLSDHTEERPVVGQAVVSNQINLPAGSILDEVYGSSALVKWGDGPGQWMSTPYAGLAIDPAPGGYQPRPSATPPKPPPVRP